MKLKRKRARFEWDLVSLPKNPDMEELMSHCGLAVM